MDNSLARGYAKKICYLDRIRKREETLDKRHAKGLLYKQQTDQIVQKRRELYYTIHKGIGCKGPNIAIQTDMRNKGIIMLNAMHSNNKQRNYTSYD